MAAAKEAVSFDEIIQAARTRRKKQALTDKFFEAKRRSSAPGSGTGSGSGAGALANRVSVVPGSLASRVGIGKRSAAPVATRKPAVPTRPARKNRKFSDLITQNSGQTTITDRGPGFSKGSVSGPCVVLGSNFAPGTTAADIVSALEPVGGAILGCRIVSTHPEVTAEMTFEEGSGAESVVARFNNQKADGRILHVRIKPGLQPPPQIPAETNTGRLRHHRSQPTFDSLREQADRERREQRRADPQVQDGRYGFDDRSQQQQHAGVGRGSRDQRGGSGSGRDRSMGNGRDTGLYSDQMVIDEPSHDSHYHGRRGR
ncbi:hypothetical protein RJZ56_000721 [Blastomyces dermatitidis]|uniref:RRM domain-containing protein n=1 Tax=Ajellomyces dermatitidis (strain ATCC 18188 / CBS 674.68) TaxID=653446 RepID=F2T630_AJEDA|nr:hypothetical protein BDDG_01630 [Blastomyces dermatitidis ATCC 18188]